MSNPYTPDRDDLEALLRIGAIKLERTAGIPTWEAQPGSRHQMVVDRIRASIAPLSDNAQGCGCYHLADVAIRFPDGSLKRPDVAIFCAPPPFIGLLTVIECCGTPVLPAWTERSGVNVSGCAVRCLRSRCLEATENITTREASLYSQQRLVYTNTERAT